MKAPSSTFKSAIGRLSFAQTTGTLVTVTRNEKFACQLKDNKITKLECHIILAPDGGMTTDATSLKVTYDFTEQNTVAIPTKAHLATILKEILNGFIRHIERVEPNLPGRFKQFAKSLQQDKIEIQIASKLEQIEQLVKEIRELNEKQQRAIPTTA